MSNILISVIIPVYNVERYLEECLNSIISQTINEFEVICINDGSTDNSLKILECYQRKDSRIKVVSIENSKQGKCRNLAMTLAKGEYIMFIDSDDYIEKNTMKDLLEKIEKTNIDIVMYNGRSFQDGEKYIFNETTYFNLNRSIEDKVFSGKEFAKYGISCVSPCMKIYNKNFLIDNNILFEEGIYGEDDIFWYRCCIYATRVSYLNKEKYLRRYRTNSVMTSFNVNIIRDRLNGIKKIEKLLLNIHKDEESMCLFNHLSKYTFNMFKSILKLNKEDRKELYKFYMQNNYKAILKVNSNGIIYNFKIKIIEILGGVISFIDRKL